MGGYYSTRWNGHIRKCTVESCLTFDLKTIPITDYMAADSPQMYSYKWTYTRDNRPAGNIGIVYKPEARELVFVYTGKNDNESHDIKERIQVSTTPLNFGGVRYWIHCPHCGRRTRTLHKPPARLRFHCRQCWNLTYESVQTAHKWDRGAFIGLKVLLDTEDRLIDLYAKLRKTRSYRGALSKQRKRLLAKIDKLEAMQWEIVERRKAGNARMRQRVASALELVDPEAAREFIENDWT